MDENQLGMLPSLYDVEQPHDGLPGGHLGRARLRDLSAIGAIASGQAEDDQQAGNQQQRQRNLRCWCTDGPPRLVASPASFIQGRGSLP
jgi:hypothetical protein